MCCAGCADCCDAAAAAAAADSCCCLAVLCFGVVPPAVVWCVVLCPLLRQVLEGALDMASAKFGEETAEACEWD